MTDGGDLSDRHRTRLGVTKIGAMIVASRRSLIGPMMPDTHLLREHGEFPCLGGGRSIMDPHG
jgi:hypothetical protein